MGWQFDMLLIHACQNFALFEYRLYSYLYGIHIQTWWSKRKAIHVRDDFFWFPPRR